MKALIHVVVSALFLMAPIRSSADGPECESATTTGQMVRCKQEQLSVSERALASLQARIEPKLNPNQLVLLRNATLAWESFRQSNCSAVHSLFDEGTLAPLTFVGCMVAMTEWRITDVKAAYGALLENGGVP
jgi:uncharacterized protein YecT (DUF1311 family)